MFTGIIEHCGEILSCTPTETGHHLQLRAHFAEPKLGESVAVNGICLTLTAASAGVLEFDISPETQACTNSRYFKPGMRVNLERALDAHGRFGGHYVSGHVDTTARVAAIEEAGAYWKLSVNQFKPDARPFLLPKGSITLDGVSLTINRVVENQIELMLVPHTIANTTFQTLTVGQLLNVEFDYITRVIAHQLSLRDVFGTSGI